MGGKKLNKKWLKDTSKSFFRKYIFISFIGVIVLSYIHHLSFKWTFLLMIFAGILLACVDFYEKSTSGKVSQ